MISVQMNTYETAAIGTSVESHTQGLEPLLTGRVPELRER